MLSLNSAATTATRRSQAAPSSSASRAVPRRPGQIQWPGAGAGVATLTLAPDMPDGRNRRSNGRAHGRSFTWSIWRPRRPTGIRSALGFALGAPRRSPAIYGGHGLETADDAAHCASSSVLPHCGEATMPQVRLASRRLNGIHPDDGAAPLPRRLGTLVGYVAAASRYTLGASSGDYYTDRPGASGWVRRSSAKRPSASLCRRCMALVAVFR